MPKRVEHRPDPLGSDLVDWRILQEFPHAVLAFVGGVTRTSGPCASLPFIDEARNEFLHYAAYHQDAAPSPDLDVLDTAALWALFPKQSAPPPIFRYSASLPKTANPASSLAISFSYGADVVWKWDASTGQWVHTYSGQTDIDALTGKPVTTTNIVVEVVPSPSAPTSRAPAARVTSRARLSVVAAASSSATARTSR